MQYIFDTPRQTKKNAWRRIAQETLFLTDLSLEAGGKWIKVEYIKSTTNILTLMFQSSVETFYPGNLIEIISFWKKKAIHFEGACLGLLYSLFFNIYLYWTNLCLYSSIFQVCLHCTFELAPNPKSWLKQWSNPHCCIQIRKYSKTEVLWPNVLLEAAAILCLTAPRTTWKLLYCSSLQQNRAADLHTFVLDDYLLSFDHLWALSSIKMKCPWPASWDYWYTPSQLQPSQATGSLSWFVFLFTRQVEESWFPRQAQVASRGISIMVRLLFFLCDFCTHLLDGADSPKEVSFFSNFLFSGMIRKVQRNRHQERLENLLE